MLSCHILWLKSSNCWMISLLKKKTFDQIGCCASLRIQSKKANNSSLVFYIFTHNKEFSHSFGICKTHGNI
jgi:hypothetical protein